MTVIRNRQRRGVAAGLKLRRRRIDPEEINVLYRAAQLDESHDLPFAAAMNWRKAAEMSAWFTVLANSYWQQWERVMHLPRTLVT